MAINKNPSSMNGPISQEFNVFTVSNPLVGLLEPGAHKCTDSVAASVAISLKRIADILAKVNAE